ncbi:sphingomyelin phosphodiesterase 4-like [Paramacrobiotus metropolitanus]|uniref:sphingomyelin phosphodiesterase 4-like n=1 Tax=Paramacrobiotus metropolitanus TaxID=2943436 RepID=UPI00244648DE|nr:sphingomyelin phosphodiesterase 4-like [Paramacrobiotus metropolitanus]
MYDRYLRTHADPTESLHYQNSASSSQKLSYSQLAVGGSGAPGAKIAEPSNFGRDISTEISRLPLDLRFAKLFNIFTRSDFRDLQEIYYPAAVEAVFGFQSSSSTYRQQHAVVSGQFQSDQPYIPVSFCDISQNYKLVYDAGFQLLNTDGPIFRFLISVSGGRVSTSPRYYFPISCLSHAVRKSLENGSIPSWYRDKVPQNAELFSGDGLDSSAAISLSAFEFYFAHFAYHLVNPDLRTNNPAEPDCLFMALVDNYSSVFFNASAILDNQRFASSHYAGGGPLRRSLGFFQNSRTGTESGEPLGPLPQTHPLATSENLECLINTFVEFWLNTSGFTSQKYSRKYPSTPRYSDRGRHSPSFGQSPLSPGGSRRRQPVLQNVPTVFPPTCAVQAFRQIVKVLHEFAYAPVVERAYHKNMETNLLDIKRHIIPQLVQRPLYDLLKLTMRKYPMDASFRYIYELWLTYIQPWRYENVLTDIPNSDDVVIVSKDYRWYSFIMENLLFYTTLFQNFVDRMLRVDFSVPFNTLAVYRIGKVFCDTEMYQLIRNVEDQLFGVKKVAPLRSGSSPTKSIVKNHLADLEGPAYNYISFYDAENITKVRELLKVLVAAERRISRKLIDSRALRVHNRADLQYWKDLIVNGLKQLFGLVAGPVLGMKLQPLELERMSKHITKGIECFSAIFAIQYEEICEEEGEPVVVPASSGEAEFLLDRPLAQPADSVNRLRSVSTKRRQSVVDSLESSRVSYITEPENQPARTWEIAFLIPLLSGLSHHLNMLYGSQIEELYNRQDFQARLVHPLIQPPHTPVQVYGEVHGSALPPRISLRPLASTYVVGTIVFLWFFLWTTDIGYLRGGLFVVFILAAYLVSNAIVEPYRDRPTRS